MPPYGLFGSLLPQFASRLPGFIAPTAASEPSPTAPPMNWGNRLSLIGATLRDAGANLNGRQGNAIAAAQKDILVHNLTAAQQVARKKFAEAAKPTEQRGALVALSNAGGDVSPYL